MPSTFVSQKHAALAANGTTDGLAQIADNSGWLPGCTVWVSATGETSMECTIVEQVGANKIRLRSKTSTAVRGGGTDLSAFTTAKGAAVDMEGQVVPVLAPFTPRERA